MHCTIFVSYFYVFGYGVEYIVVVVSYITMNSWICILGDVTEPKIVTEIQTKRNRNFFIVITFCSLSLFESFEQFMNYW